VSLAWLAAAALVALAFPALLINLYFATLILERWPGLRRRLASLFGVCGLETSTCSIVAKTKYARMFGGQPNVLVGVLWCAALFGLAAHWAVSGSTIVPWPYLVVSAASVLVAIYLIHALAVVLKQPGPL
jgi:uncharacterized membrane protein